MGVAYEVPGGEKMKFNSTSKNPNANADLLTKIPKNNPRTSSGLVSSAEPITAAPPKIATNKPKANGTRSNQSTSRTDVTQSLNLNRHNCLIILENKLIEAISRSQMPNTKAIVPPLTPGTRSVIPTNKPIDK